MGRHPAHIPAFLRSTKIPAPKSTAAIRITELLGELGISASRLIMPTRENIEVFDGLLTAAGGLIDMKRQVDRVEQEVRTMRAQSSGFIPPVARRVCPPPLQRYDTC
jgi:DNA methyltransferase 1-associated protein 1